VRGRGTVHGELKRAAPVTDYYSKAEEVYVGPLNGIRVLDIGTVFLGPYATLILGQLGAEVVKIEPAGGDIARRVGYSRNPGMTGTFILCNEGKRSLAIDLTAPEGREVLGRLAATADIVVHNMRPNAARALGLSYQALSPCNERIIVVSAHGYSEDGPQAGLPAYDDIIQAATGAAHLEGLRYGAPQYLPSIVADKWTAMAALYSALAALYERERSGVGQDVEVPMFDVMAQFALEHFQGEVFDPPIGPAGYQRVLSPQRRPYATSDGFLAVMLYTDRHWKTFFESVGRPDIFADKRFSDVTQRTRNIDAVYETLAGFLTQRTTAEWLELFRAIDAPATEVRQVPDMLRDPDLNRRGIIRAVEHPTEGTVQSLGLPVMFSRTPGEKAGYRLAPTLGQHSREILGELGFDADEIAALQASGAVTAAGEVEQP
jgi:crotonobetainyl-CoA:carnitine CoA-transferase CaiB-like acyl-CoA transferase